MAIGDDIYSAGWRQGCLIGWESIPQLGDDQGAQFADFVLVSHSCDVTSNDLADEPYAEFMGRTKIDAADGNCTFGKSPRTLHMGDEGGRYELRAHHRFNVPRSALAGLSPAGTIPDDELRLLQRWMANRYARSAFPDEFNRRRSNARDQIAKLLKASGHLLSGIYIAVTDDELAEGVDYNAYIFVTVLASTHADQAMRTECHSTMLRLTECLESCDGIHVVDAELRSESEFSVTELRQTRRWDSDAFSLREESDESALPPADA